MINQVRRAPVKVSIKSFDVKMDVKNKGVEFQITDNRDTFLGDFIVTKTGLIWCQGKTKRENGRKVSWTKFIELAQRD